MRKIYYLMALLLSILIFQFDCSNDQQQEIDTFLKIYDRDLSCLGKSVVETEDCYIICGYSDYESTNVHSKALLIKTDKQGNEINSQYYGEGWFNTAHSVLRSSDNNLLVAGTTTWTPYGESTDILLLTLHDDLEPLWTGTYDNFWMDIALSIVDTEDNDIFSLGFTNSETQSLEITSVARRCLITKSGT